MGYQAAGTVILLGLMACSAFTVDSHEHEILCKQMQNSHIHRHLCEHHGTTGGTSKATSTTGFYRITTTVKPTTAGYTSGKEPFRFFSDATTRSFLPTSIIPAESISNRNTGNGDFTTTYMTVFLVGIVVAVGGFLICRYAGRAGMALVNCHFNKANRGTVRYDDEMMSV